MLDSKEERRPVWQAACYAQFNFGLEVQPDFRRQRTRCDVVRAAEGGKEVVECILVGQVDGRELETDLVLVPTEDVVMPNGHVEKTSRRDAGRILVVVLRVGF